MSPVGDVVKPILSKKASPVWDRLAPVALAMGTLTVADVTAFARLCELQAILDSAALQRDEPETYTAALKIERDFAPIVRPFYALFGLEPVSRARIHVPKKNDKPASKWAGALA